MSDCRTTSDGCTANEAPVGPGLLAQIPDVRALGQPPAAEAGPANRDARILSPGTSAKILLGGGLLLLLVAVLPFVFGRKDDPARASEDEAARPKVESPAGLASLAPSWEGNTAQALKEAAVEPAACCQRNTPMGGPAEVAGQGEPVRRPLGEPVPPSTRAPGGYVPEQYAVRPVPAEVLPPPSRYPRTRAPLEYDAAGPPAPVETNRPMALRPRVRPPIRYEADAAAREYRDDRAANRRSDYGARPSVRMADTRQAAGPRQPASSDAGAREPGVARFKGIIEKPTVRTTHDGAGSSIY